MKKLVFFFALAFAVTSCNCVDSTPVVEDSDAFPICMEIGDLVINVSKGAWLSTKNQDFDYYTISAVNTDLEPLIVESNIDENGNGVSSHYLSDGTRIASFTFEGGCVVSAQLFDDEVTRAGGDRVKGEKYVDCVKRVYREEKNAIENRHPILADAPVVSGILWGVELYCGIVGCSEYKI